MNILNLTVITHTLPVFALLKVLSCNSKKKEFVEVQLEVLPDVEMELIRCQHDVRIRYGNPMRSF